MPLFSKNPTKVIDENSVCDFVKGTSLLNCLPDEDIRRIAKKCRTMSFQKGDIIFKTGDPSNWFYVIYEGIVEEYVGYEGSICIIVKNRKRHDYIGEMGILTGKPCLDTAVAMSPLTLIAVPKEVFSDIVWGNIGVVKQLMTELVGRITHTAKLQLANMYLDASGRLALTLVSLASSSPKGNLVNVTQSDLAAAVGIARQTAAKIIGKWKEKNIITAYRGSIVINDMETILDIAAGKNRLGR